MGKPSKAERLKILGNLQKEINKSYGKDVLLTAKQAKDSGVFDRNITPTPSIELNNALYCGGLSGIVELFGPPASGKTSLAIETIAKAQKEDPDFMAIWLETEDSVTTDLLEQHGVDLSRISFVEQHKFGNAEEALDVFIAGIRNNIFDIGVVNSVAGLLPKQEEESDLEKQNVARTAQLMSKLFRKITGYAADSKCNLIFINQLREKVGVMYGDNTTTTGGRALGFYAHQRIRMNSLTVKKEDPISPEEGIKVSCIVYKNRFANMNNPNTKCTYYANFKTGIDSIVAIPGVLAERGIFSQGGAWWYYPNKDNIQTLAGVECKFNSRASLLDALRNNKPFLDEVMKLIDISYVDAEEKDIIDKDEASINQLVSSSEGGE